MLGDLVLEKQIPTENFSFLGLFWGYVAPCWVPWKPLRETPQMEEYFSVEVLVKGNSLLSRDLLEPYTWTC